MERISLAGLRLSNLRLENSHVKKIETRPLLKIILRFYEYLSYSGTKMIILTWYPPKPWCQGDSQVRPVRLRLVFHSDSWRGEGDQLKNGECAVSGPWNVFLKFKWTCRTSLLSGRSLYIAPNPKP